MDSGSVCHGRSRRIHSSGSEPTRLSITRAVRGAHGKHAFRETSHLLSPRREHDSESRYPAHHPLVGLGGALQWKHLGHWPHAA